MRVQHNILAMNSYRNYTGNVKALGGNLEKLSSGYKINRAGDDAAGLAISEKMRAQIKGLEAAQKNVKDATSFVKTAEGAMQEIQDMLGRMKYLATQSANGTYENEVDRDNIQLEVDALLEEIDRIAEAANFNGIHMLKGGGTPSTGTPNVTFDDAEVAGYTTTVANAASVGAGAVTVSLQKTEAVPATTASVTATVAGVDMKFVGAKNDTLNDLEITVKFASNSTTASTAEIDGDGNLTVTLAGSGTKFTGITDKDTLASAIQQAIAAATYAGSVTDADDKAALADTLTAWKGVTVTAGTAGGYVAASVAADANLASGVSLTGGNAGQSAGYTVTVTSAKGTDTWTGTTWTGNASISVASTNSGVVVAIDTTKVTEPGTTATSTKIGEVKSDGGGGGDKYSITMQIGDSANEKLAITIGSMKTDAIKGEKTDAISSLKGSGVSSITAANAAIDTIKEAINYVSSVRGQLGAYQNRLDHTAKNLSVMAENIQDAESSIRDTDVAEEMMSYVKNNILVQSAQAMLAQANQVPQGVLQLLG